MSTSTSSRYVNDEGRIRTRSSLGSYEVVSSPIIHSDVRHSFHNFVPDQSQEDANWDVSMIRGCDPNDDNLGYDSWPMKEAGPASVAEAAARAAANAAATDAVEQMIRDSERPPDPAPPAQPAFQYNYRPFPHASHQEDFTESKVESASNLPLHGIGSPRHHPLYMPLSARYAHDASEPACESQQVTSAPAIHPNVAVYAQFRDVGHMNSPSSSSSDYSSSHGDGQLSREMSRSPTLPVSGELGPLRTLPSFSGRRSQPFYMSPRGSFSQTSYYPRSNSSSSVDSMGSLGGSLHELDILPSAREAGPSPYGGPFGASLSGDQDPAAGIDPHRITPGVPSDSLAGTNAAGEQEDYFGTVGSDSQNHKLQLTSESALSRASASSPPSDTASDDCKYLPFSCQIRENYSSVTEMEAASIENKSFPTNASDEATQAGSEPGKPHQGSSQAASAEAQSSHDRESTIKASHVQPIRLATVAKDPPLGIELTPQGTLRGVRMPMQGANPSTTGAFMPLDDATPYHEMSTKRSRGRAPVAEPVEGEERETHGELIRYIGTTKTGKPKKLFVYVS